MLMRRALHFDSTALTASMITLVIFGTELFFYHRWKLGPCICYLCVSTLVQATVVSPRDLVLRVLTIDLPGLSSILWLQVSLVCILFFVEEGLLWWTLRCLSSLWCLSFSDLHDLFQDFLLLCSELFCTIFQSSCSGCNIHRVVLDVLYVRVELFLLLLEASFNFLEDWVFANARSHSYM